MYTSPKHGAPDMKALIIIPTYNEIKNIEALLEAIFKEVPSVNILVIDDASPDGTGQLIDRLIKEKYPDSLFVRHRPGKNGLGTAYIEGFQWGLGKGYDVFIEMDADFSHNPAYLPQMLSLIEKHDCVIGSRYVAGGGVENWGLIRRIISWGGSLYARLVLLTNVHDFTGGFNCFRRENLIAIKPKTILSKGYCFQIEMKFRHKLLGKEVYEMPIIFPDRVAGTSKMNSSIFKEAIFKVIKLSLMRHKIKSIMKG